VRIGLRCKLLLREQKWRLAETVLSQTTNRNSPQYRGLRLDILSQKVKDSTVSPGEREAALRERETLADESPRKRLVLETDPLDAEEDGDDDRPEPAAS
jgi:hypothetical protein